jgi:2-polyprenyl-6-methoxyphenol hydroxylase-like FAD-dependent oxidoreductase
MTGERRFSCAVLGAGPVGLACAITAARSGDVLLIDRAVGVARAGGSSVGDDVVEAVPPRLLHVLCDLGVDPARLDAEGPFFERMLAWESLVPARVAGSGAIHVRRGSLERGLREVVEASARIVRTATEAWELVPEGVRGPDWTAGRILDCTGRRATCAASIHRAAPAWVARTWTFRGSDADPRFKLAIVEDGYFYRLGTRDSLTLAFVSPSPRRSATWAEAADEVARAGCAWIAAGLPRREAHPEPVRTASFQWSSPPDDARIRLVGDAALARDALSSSGLACGLSDALRAATYGAAREGDQREDQATHAEALVHHIARSCQAKAAAWRRYADWLGSEQSARRASTQGTAGPLGLDARAISDASSRLEKQA